MVILTISEVECMNCDRKFKTAVPQMWLQIHNKTKYKNVHGLGIEAITLCELCRTNAPIINLPKILKNFGYKTIKIKKHFKKALKISII